MKRMVVLSGAGMSAESGISTFRDSSDGLWENYSVEEVASIHGFEKNPALVLEFYNARRRAYIGCTPNAGHYGLASFERYFHVDVITQNVDDLHERAGSSSVIHLHGELMKNCSVRNPYTTYPVDPDNLELHLGDLAPDGSQLRPFIVWFGEAVPMIEPASKLVGRADIVVVIGTSLAVYPAAGLLHCVPSGSPIYFIDPRPIETTLTTTVEQIQAPATRGVRILANRLGLTL